MSDLVLRHGYEPSVANWQTIRSQSLGLQRAYNVDGVDFSEFQYSPEFTRFDHRFVAIRSNHGTYKDPTFPEYWANLAQLPIRWLFVYFLPTTVSSVANQIRTLMEQLEDSGVEWQPNMGYCFDVEGAHAAGVDTVRAMNGLLSTELQCPTGLLYTGVYSSVADLGRSGEMPWWLPWPVQTNGPILENFDVVTTHQWGTAGPGEVAGFPSDAVDVNEVYNPDMLDQLVKGQATNMAITEDEFARINALIRSAAEDVTGNFHDKYLDLANKLDHLTGLVEGLAPADPGMFKSALASIRTTINTVLGSDGK